MDENEGAEVNNTEGVKTVYRDFKGRRAAIIKALTTDYDDFFLQCDPEKGNLCLYGHPDKRWEVKLSTKEVPPQIPQPMPGINFPRDEMPIWEWLSLVAAHSDSWLMSVASFIGSKFCLNKSERLSLFRKMNDLPTISETAIAFANKRFRRSITGHIDDEEMNVEVEDDEEVNVDVEDDKEVNVEVEDDEEVNVEVEDDEEVNVDVEDDEEVNVDVEDDEEVNVEVEDDDKGIGAMCRICNKRCPEDDFLIFCGVCGTWLHGKCGGITEAELDEYTTQYKCTSCCTTPRP